MSRYHETKFRVITKIQRRVVNPVSRLQSGRRPAPAAPTHSRPFPGAPPPGPHIALNALVLKRRTG
ncbi:hypothetical protein O3Q52_12060 [Streptomyces sp. ActVer]|uniref:hypothetical protein n=1 Tax=Streptomyces sp. ActVer TaxID=3014558 RepID=UPI0022B4914A|nr:hypothetical protein [Streptomyces sp. ActVer]MCZ4508928.1 hypothetical protein [Streptomyces sp. ActVer]